VYNYIHALSVHRPYIVDRKKNGTPGRRARGSSFFEPSQESGTEAVRTPLTPPFQVHVERPTGNDGPGTPTHTQPGSFERSNRRTNERLLLLRNPIGFSGRPGPPLSVHCVVVSVVSPAFHSVDRQTR
jgi:hypothetical protein